MGKHLLNLELRTDISLNRVLNESDLVSEPEQLQGEDGEVFVYCEYCGRQFFGPHRISHRRLHIRTVHLKIKKYSCPKCRKMFARIDNQKRHTLACSPNFKI